MEERKDLGFLECSSPLVLSVVLYIAYKRFGSEVDH